MKMQIKYKMLAPVSHIGETASSGAYFQTILTSDGRVPVITGNSIRGQIRDSIALHLLDLLDARVNKDTFNILFSGGNLNGTMKDDVEKAKGVRAHFPSVSLLGGGLGDMIMSGKLIVSFAYPVCMETEDITGVPSILSWHNLIDEIEFSRMDDGKKDTLAGYMTDADAEKTAKASTQMRFSVQYMAAGTEFVQNFLFLPGTTELELGAFYAGIAKWFAVPRLGGMSAKGFGLFDAELDDAISVHNGVVTISDEARAYISKYEEFVRNEGTEYFSLFDTSTKKVKKNGKESDNPD